MSATLEALEAQARYARWLARGTRGGLALLVLAFLAYAGGLLAPHVAFERMPELWTQPAAAFLEATGVRPGWDWGRLAHRGDMLVLAAIAFLASCSIACLAAVIPVFARRREEVLVAVCVLQIAVLVLAASGMLSGAH